MTPRRAAWATASVRPTASNLSIRAPTWNLAVWTDIPRRRAIALFDIPSARRVSTSSSRGVSGTSPSAETDTIAGGTRATSADSLPRTSRKPGTFASNAASRSASGLSSMLRANRIGLGLRRSCSSGRPFGDCQRNILGFATPTQSERNGLAYAIRPERA